MIFSKRPLSQIRSGRKTQIRRPVTAPGPCSFKVGHDYGVRPPHGDADSEVRIRITTLDRERLGDITFNDARAEGYRTRDEFLEAWRETYPDTDEDTWIWVLTFTAVTGVHLLRRGAGYTSDPDQSIDPELEALDRKALDDLSSDARKRWREAHAEEIARREAKARAARLREVEAQARSNGIDVSDEVATIDAATERMRRKLETAA